MILDRASLETLSMTVLVCRDRESYNTCQLWQETEQTLQKEIHRRRFSFRC